jgi:hypothetical protein
MRDRLHVPRPGPAGLTRRGFLAGVTAASLLAACGNEDDDGATGSDGGSAGDGGSTAGIVGGLSAVRFFGPYYRATHPARVPFGLSDDEGLLSADLAPGELGVTVRGPDGEEAASGLTASLYDDGLPRPYYAFEFVPQAAGFYDVVIDAGDGGEVVTQVQIVEEDDPAASAIVAPGDPLPELQTPTVDDARGVTPLCTREPACDLHARTAAEIVAAGEPMALLVATPAFCQTVICGPVLDVLLGVLPDVPGVTGVHAEVFADPENNSVPPTEEDYAPVVGQLGLAFEPVLYTIGSDGVVRDRLDYIFGEAEIRRVLEDLVA